jgi:hypothetical protein
MPHPLVHSVQLDPPLGHHMHTGTAVEDQLLTVPKQQGCLAPPVPLPDGARPPVAGTTHTRWWRVGLCALWRLYPVEERGDSPAGQPPPTPMDL